MGQVEVLFGKRSFKFQLPICKGPGGKCGAVSRCTAPWRWFGWVWNREMGEWWQSCKAGELVGGVEGCQINEPGDWFRCVSTLALPTAAWRQVAIRCARAILPFPLRVRRGRAKITSVLTETHFSVMGLTDHYLEDWTLTSYTVMNIFKAPDCIVFNCFPALVGIFTMWPLNTLVVMNVLKEQTILYFSEDDYYYYSYPSHGEV